MIPFLTLDDANVTHQNILIRLDLNLPMQDGRIIDATRIERCLPTLQELIQRQAKIIILSHFGRPKGKVNKDYSLKPIAEALKEFISAPIAFVSDCIGPDVNEAVNILKSGEILLLENLRFYAQEEANDSNFAHQLAKLGNVFVNDAFSCSHRAHASVVGIPQYLPSYAGRSMEQEINALSRVLVAPKHPVMAIVGGSKVSTKLDLLKNLMDKMDYIVIGGGMANTFLKAQGTAIGASLVEDGMLSTAQEILHIAQAKGCHFILPMDVRVTDNLKPDSPNALVDVTQVEKHHIIADIGPKTIHYIQDKLDMCQTVVWNGPVGVFEIPPFDQGSIELAKYIAQKTQQGLTSVAGGGDTLAALNLAQCGELTYTSTAGGAFLEWLEGKSLPGIDALIQAKDRLSSKMEIA